MKQAIGLTGASGNLGKKFQTLFNKKLLIKKFKGNIKKKSDIKSWLNKNNFTAVIHFAAIVPTKKVKENYKEALRVNQIGTKNLVECIINYMPNLEWFFYASTSHVYSETPKKIRENNKKLFFSKYGKSKYLGEKEIIKRLKKRNIPYAIGRIFSVIDNQEKTSLFNNLKSKLIENKKKEVVLKYLNHYRDFLSTNEICYIIFKLYRKKYSGIINIASGKKTYLKNIAIKLAKKNNKKLKFKDGKKCTSLVADISKLKKLKIHKKNFDIFKYI